MSTVIAITGMNGCGKTTIMQNLAATAALHNLSTACFSCDMTYPDLQMRFCGTKIDESNTLDHLFLEADPASRFTPAKNIPNLFITGVPLSATAISYDPPDSLVQQERFIANLKTSPAFDVIFIEAGNPVTNSFAQTAIETADLLLNIITATENGLDYFSSFIPFLKDLREDAGMLHVLYRPWHHIANNQIKAYEKNALATIPHCTNAAYGHQTGLPLALKKKQNRIGRDVAYMKAINTICRQVTSDAEGGR